MSEVGTGALAVRQTIRIEAPRERVFALLTEVAQVPRWFPITVFEPHLGGRVEVVRDGWHAEGEVIEFEPPRVVAYTWDWRNQPLGSRTEVRWELEEDGGGTLVRLSHIGFPEQAQRESHSGGWTYYGQRLKIVAEGGQPGPDRMGEV